jgi:AcrR family transcriptional regulator
MASPRATRLTRRERHALTRAQLLDAAERVFAREGFRGASVAAIAAEAGYSHGAVYSNFDGKYGLFLALVEERIDARLAKVYETADAELGRGGEPLETAKRFLSIVQQQRDAYLLLVDFWNEAVRDPTAAAKFAERHARLRGIVGRIVEHAAHQQGQRLSVPADQAAIPIIALFNGFAIEGLADPDAASDDLLAHALAAILRGFTDRPSHPLP